MMSEKIRAQMKAQTAKKWAKKNKRNQRTANPVQEIKSSLLNVSEGNVAAASLPIWSQIMQVADEKGHFASDIVEKALDGKRISDKQAWVVGKFATENGVA